MKAMFGLILALAATTTRAHVHNLVDLQVIDRDTGRIIEVHHKGGRAYVAGEPGHRYCPLVEGVEVVSEFRSEQLGPERRAVQFRVTFRAPDRTIRDEEVDQSVARMLKAVERQLDAKLRTA